MSFDVTQAMRSQFYDASSYAYVTTRGFMIKGNLSTAGIYTVLMSEYGTVGLRPKVIAN